MYVKYVSCMYAGHTINQSINQSINPFIHSFIY